MASTVEQIKEKLSIHDVVSSYIKLQKAGKNYRAQCPFHSDNDPSFYVSPERDSYYCFGCNAKGDIFTFVEEFEGLDFQGALKLLAERAGVEITYQRGPDRSVKDTIREVLEVATLFYSKALSDNKEAQKYIQDRGISKETRDTFRLGYAPDGWRGLYDHAREKGFTDEDLLRAGLAKKKDDGGYYDTFRARIMFPVMDTSGRVIGFSGRVFPEPKDKDEHGERSAKYLNTPETVLFHKSDVLYGYNKAKGSMRKNDFCIVAEGQVDVLMVHQAGFGNAVAPLGTALTPGHLRLIERMTKNLLLALDADNAGVASSQRSAALALSRGFDVKIARLPSGKDPADVINEDPETWRSAVRGATHIIEFLLDVIGEREKDERKRASAIHQEVLPFVRRIDNKIDQAHFVKMTAQRLGVKEDTIIEEINKLPEEREIVAQRDTTPEEARSRKDLIIRRLLGVISWVKKNPNKDVLVEEVTKELEKTTGTTVEEFLRMYDPDELLFEAEVTLEDADVSLAGHVEEMLRNLKEDYLRADLSKLLGDLRLAEREKDAERAEKILKECQRISQQVEKLKQKA